MIGYSRTRKNDPGSVVPAEIFVDTSAWYPLVVRNHPDHRKLASGLNRAVRDGKRIVTTNLVLVETHALLLRRTTRDTALTFARTVRQAPNLVVSSTPELEASALGEWLERFDDQGFSLTDGVSFAVMSERGIREALTLDRHFTVAGFVAVP